MIQRLLSVMSAVLGLVFVGCATLPRNAPSEFKDARTALDKLDERDVDDFLPNTVDRANLTYDQAVELLQASRVDRPKGARTDAVQEARKAKQIADGALQLHAQIVKWDDQRGGMKEALAIIHSEGKNAKRLAAYRQSTSPFAKLKGTEFRSTIAYFPTGAADSPDFNSGEMEALVNILGKDERFSVVLTGAADVRGPDEVNMKLGMARAEAVAKELQDRGVKESQITYRSVGKDNARATKGNIARLQLDRNVQAVVTLD